MPELAKVSVRAGVDPDVCQRALLAAVGACHVYRNPWASVVEVDGARYVVGQGHPEYYIVLPFPFAGHADSWKIILPINSAADLLRQLEGR